MDDYSQNNITDTNEETDRKCPQCGGVMAYHPATGNLKCPYCDYEEEIKSEEKKPERAKELDFFQAEHTANKDWGVNTKTVLCKACGAQSIYDVLQTSAVCPFCGSNQVMDAPEQDTMSPGGVVPFRVSDKEASALFHKWIRRRWFCPKLAKDSAKPKHFKGIYLPYWTFDSQTHSSYHGEYGITSTYVDDEGNSHSTTTWHRTSGKHKEFFNDELVLASSSHDTSMLGKIEPFDTENNKSYDPEYIAGFIAERYSLGLKDAWDKAMKSIKRKLKNEIDHKIRLEHGADQVCNLKIRTEFQDITYKYLLLPIWISNYKYKDKVYQFMVNGQTGKVAGHTPISIPKVVITVLGIMALLALLYYLDIFG